MTPRWKRAIVRFSALLVASLLFSCGVENDLPTEKVPSPTSTPSSSPRERAEVFLRAWEVEDYNTMYELLSARARQKISPQDFALRYRNIHQGIELRSLATNVTREWATYQGTEVDVAVILNSSLVGRFEITNTIPLVWEGDNWWVDWSPRLIFRQLDEDELVNVAVEEAPRGEIFDRNGLPLATYRPLVSIGVIPGLIEDEGALLDQLSAILGMTPSQIRGKYVGAPRLDWFMAVKTVPFEVYRQNREVLESLPGVAAKEAYERYYPQGTVGAQVVGYIGPITAEELAARRDKGYTEANLIGKKGLEWWGEDYLAGHRGGVIRTVTAEGQVRDIIARKRAVRGRDLYSTLDLELQAQVEKILGDQQGAIVVMDPRNSEVLAMASYPSFDPNDLMGGGISVQGLLSDPRAPLLNRCTQGVYPLGSVFKVITMAAAMEELGSTSQTPFHCTGIWQGLGSQWAKTCWYKPGHGNIDLFTGLVKSCDVVFYDLGLALDTKDPQLLPSYASRFGLGQATGLIGGEEAMGLIPTPAWKRSHFAGTWNENWLAGDAVNLAIGQGYILVTPLQAAQLLASIGNGGILLRPTLVRKVAESVEETELIFSPEELGHLPASAENLGIIKAALTGVVSSKGGTAHYQFLDINFTAAGKTGTAETPQEDPHSWFVGYTPAENPILAIAVLVENAGEGSKVAAPIFRKVVEVYLELEKRRAGSPTPEPGLELTPTVPVT